MIDGFYRPIPPTSFVVVDESGQYGLCEQVCLLPIPPPSQICFCGPSQDFTIIPGKQTVLVTINGLLPPEDDTGRICSDTFHRVFREFAFCNYRQEDLCLVEPFKCPACTPDMLAIAVDGNRKHYRFKKSRGTDEPSLFDGLFIAQDSKVSAFVDKIRSQMTIVKWGGRSQEGAGNTVGEEVEQVNSFLSRAALTTKYMTKSVRADMITVLAMQWNHRKVENLHKTLSKRFVKTTQRAQTEVDNLESLKQELNISLEDTEQWVLEVKQWAATDSNQTRQRKRRRLTELKKKLRERILQYNTIDACTEKIDAEAACSLSEDVILPWEVQGDVVSLRTKRRLFDQVMLVRRMEKEKVIIVKDMTQHCQNLRQALDKLDHLLDQTKDDIRNQISPSDITEEGYRGLHCCLLHHQYLLEQKLSRVTSTYTCIGTDLSFLMMGEDIEDGDEDNEQDGDEDGDEDNEQDGDEDNEQDGDEDNEQDGDEDNEQDGDEDGDEDNEQDGDEDNEQDGQRTGR
ncbi:hypothetical protein NQZ68_003394 [Dissostichus eleginoides]|nr:hypothetical protein NQZ68_003394 [Dissostichus eleginoides]